MVPRGQTPRARPTLQTLPVACSAASRASPWSKDSSTLERSSPSAPGSSRAIASISVSAGSSPPLTTKSPTDSSRSTPRVTMRSSNPSYRPAISTSPRQRRQALVPDAGSVARPAPTARCACCPPAIAPAPRRSPPASARASAPCPVRRHTGGHPPSGAHPSCGRAGLRSLPSAARARWRGPVPRTSAPPDDQLREQRDDFNPHRPASPHSGRGPRRSTLRRYWGIAGIQYSAVPATTIMAVPGSFDEVVEPAQLHPFQIPHREPEQIAPVVLALARRRQRTAQYFDHGPAQQRRGVPVRHPFQTRHQAAPLNPSPPPAGSRSASPAPGAGSRRDSREFLPADP